MKTMKSHCPLELWKQFNQEEFFFTLLKVNKYRYLWASSPNTLLLPENVLTVCLSACLPLSFCLSLSAIYLFLMKWLDDSLTVTVRWLRGVWFWIAEGPPQWNSVVDSTQSTTNKDKNLKPRKKMRVNKMKKKTLRDNMRVKERILSTPTLQTSRMFAGGRMSRPVITLDTVEYMESNCRDAQVLREADLTCQHFCWNEALWRETQVWKDWERAMDMWVWSGENIGHLLSSHLSCTLSSFL